MLNSSHWSKLENFNEVFVQGKGDIKQNGEIIPLEYAYTGIQPIEYDAQIANKLSSMKAKHGNIGKQKLSMSKMNPDTNILDRVVFSLEEARAAQKSWKNIIVSQGKKYIKDRIKQKTGINKLSSLASKLKLPTINQIISTSISRSR